MIAFKDYLSNGGNIFISGAYIGTDIKENNIEDNVGNILKFKWRTNHASRNGCFYFLDSTLLDERLRFYTDNNPEFSITKG